MFDSDERACGQVNPAPGLLRVPVAGVVAAGERERVVRGVVGGVGPGDRAGTGVVDRPRVLGRVRHLGVPVVVAEDHVTPPGRVRVALVDVELEPRVRGDTVAEQGAGVVLDHDRLGDRFDTGLLAARHTDDRVRVISAKRLAGGGRVAISVHTLDRRVEVAERELHQVVRRAGRRRDRADTWAGFGDGTVTGHVHLLGCGERRTVRGQTRQLDRGGQRFLTALDELAEVATQRGLPGDRVVVQDRRDRRAGPAGAVGWWHTGDRDALEVEDGAAGRNDGLFEDHVTPVGGARFEVVGGDRPHR